MAIRRNITVGNLPIICWRNLVTSTNVYAESETDYPISNVANPSYALKWRHEFSNSPFSSLEYITIDISGDCDYVAIAGHNFGTAGIAVGLEVAAGLAGVVSPLGEGDSVLPPTIPDDDSPIVFLFNHNDKSPSTAIESLRILFVPSAVTPAEIGVIYAGQYTQLPEGIQGDHTPLPLSRQSEVVSGKSENGSFLGRVTLNEGLQSTASIANLSQAYIRDQIQPFLEFASENPFFWCWSPTLFPAETAFAWLENDPQPSVDIDGYMAIDLDMRGLNE